MAERFFLDSQLIEPAPHRGDTVAALAGLVAAVALFVCTLSVIASQHDRSPEPASSAEPPTSLPRAQAPSEGAT